MKIAIAIPFYGSNMHATHRRRINTEAKANVVASVEGTEFIQFLAALAVLNLDDLKNRINCPRIL